LPVEVKAEVLSFGFYRHWGSVQEYRRASNRSRGNIYVYIHGIRKCALK